MDVHTNLSIIDMATDEINLLEIRDIIRSNTFFMQHRLREDEVAANRLSYLRRYSADAIAKMLTETQKIEFRQIDGYPAGTPAFGPVSTYRAAVTCISQEDVQRLEEMIHQLVRIYGPRVRYRK
jgi:hypothetical protein